MGPVKLSNLYYLVWTLKGKLQYSYNCAISALNTPFLFLFHQKKERGKNTSVFYITLHLVPFILWYSDYNRITKEHKAHRSLQEKRNTILCFFFTLEASEKMMTASPNIRPGLRKVTRIPRIGNISL